MGCLAGRPAPIVDVDSPLVLVHGESVYVAKTGSFKEDYKIIRVISPGEHRRVLEVERKGSKERFVLKHITKPTGLSMDAKELLKEVKIVTTLDHPNLIKLLEVYEEKDKYALVQEMLTGGELFDYISHCEFLDESVAANIMKQLLSAVSYCHQKKVVLRNIKPENIILASIPSSHQDLHIKLVDFGMSTLITCQRRLHKIVGTQLYMAPEVFSGNYDEACDVWSCGVVLYVMLSGTMPFTGSSPEEIQSSIRLGEYSLSSSHWSLVTPEAKDLIQKMLVLQPGCRITAAEALHHPWLAGHAKVDLVHQAKSQGLMLELRKFQGEKKLKQALGGFITDRFAHEDDLAEQRKHFEALDKDHSGYLSRWELIDAFSITMSAEEAAQQVDSILLNMDSDKSQTVDYREFMSAATMQCKLLSEKILEKAFEHLDENGDGKLSVSELKHILGQSVQGSDQSIRDLIAQADVNHDGMLSLKEFMALMTQK